METQLSMAQILELKVRNMLSARVMSYWRQLRANSGNISNSCLMGYGHFAKCTQAACPCCCHRMKEGNFK